MRVFLFFLIFLGCVGPAHAEEIRLKNGDKVTGAVIAEDEMALTLATEAFGEIRVKKALIASRGAAEKKEEPPRLWKNQIAAGYSKTTGNTRKSRFHADVTSKKKTEQEEVSLRANLAYSSADNKMDSQKWYGMGRYAHAIGDPRKWYYFSKLEADHDRFAGIDYRLTPSAGLTHWFSNLPRLKALAESGFGLERTVYNTDLKPKTELVMTPRFFVEKGLWKDSLVSQEVALYPSLSDLGNLRLRSESAFVNRINGAFSLKLSFVDEYNSAPGLDTKRTDTRFMTSLLYSF